VVPPERVDVYAILEPAHAVLSRRSCWGTNNAMIEEMATVRITEAELARDIHAVLAKVQEGVEVIVEQDHRPVAVIKTPQGPGRKISECIALAKAHEEKLGYAPVTDPDFAKDVQAAVDAHREPFSPPPWD
jgi:antitoxin (DNA-binding transcriptional repressor) of toxin-antitoxin stability system